MKILFVAAENGALPGGKVGGIGDVVRDLPLALASHGAQVAVVTPSHGFLHLRPGSTKTGTGQFRFGGLPQWADVYEVPALQAHDAVKHLVIDHPLLGVYDGAAGRHRIYTDDPPDRPFFTDATRFAFFSTAVAAALAGELIGPVEVMHLHDWHAALVALLGRFHPDFASIGRLHSVFSIHNLAFQGVRPLRGSASSLEAWFPELHYDWSVVADPRWHDCINPMAVGIRLADRVHTVSPSYAREIREPSRQPQYYGGEGLEGDLAKVHASGRLIGILNGCFYLSQKTAQRPSYSELQAMIRQAAIGWSAGGPTVPTAQFLAFARTLGTAGPPEVPDVLLTSVGRVGEQKMLLLLQPGSNGLSGLRQILEGLGDRGRYILLGSGDGGYERVLAETSARQGNFIFVNGYSDAIAQALYAAGDLFLMPSSFEPCGLSQMLAMREGQPCVVHAVGGLKDTVVHGENGFAFSGDTLEAQVDQFVHTTLAAVALRRQDGPAWRRLCQNAADTRFTWEKTAEQYLRQLYAI